MSLLVCGSILQTGRTSSAHTTGTTLGLSTRMSLNRLSLVLVCNFSIIILIFKIMIQRENMGTLKSRSLDCLIKSVRNFVKNSRFLVNRIINFVIINTVIVAMYSQVHINNIFFTFLVLNITTIVFKLNNSDAGEVQTFSFNSVG